MCFVNCIITWHRGNSRGLVVAGILGKKYRSQEVGGLGVGTEDCYECADHGSELVLVCQFSALSEADVASEPSLVQFQSDVGTELLDHSSVCMGLVLRG